MEHHIILYISDQANDSNSVLAALREAGCEVVNTNSPTEGVALLYIMHTVTAVVLDERSREHASFDVARCLRKIRPNVPVMIQCGEQIDTSPASTDSCVSTDKLTSALQDLLTAEAVV